MTECRWAPATLGRRRCQPAAVKSSNVAAVSWRLAQISRKREQGEERSGYKEERERWWEEEEEEEQGATLTVAPQASNGSLSLSLSLFLAFYFPPPVCVTSRRSVPGRPVLSGGVACSHRVPGRAPSAFHAPPLPAPLILHRPSRVALATSRFAVGPLPGSPSNAAPGFSPVLAAHCSRRPPHCAVHLLRPDRLHVHSFLLTSGGQYAIHDSDSQKDFEMLLSSS